MKRVRNAPPPCSGSLTSVQGHRPAADGKTGICGTCGSSVPFTIDVSARPVPRFHKSGPR